MARTKFKARKEKVAKDAFSEKKKRKREEREQGGPNGQTSNSPPAKKRDTKSKPISLPTKAPAQDEGESSIPNEQSAEVIATLPQRPTPINNYSTTNLNLPSTLFQTPPLLAELSNAYDITVMNIISSSSINKKATRALEVLGAYPVDKTKREKEKIVVLQAKAKVASKMVSVVEICKREIGKEGGKWFQYNAVGEARGEIKGIEGVGKGVDKGEGGDGEVAEKTLESEGEDESFETMKTPFERAIEGKPKIRAVPVMMVYLSRIRIDSLRKAHGEQTNGLEKKS